MKRFFLLTMGVVVIVAGGLFALTLVDINRYKPEIETAARDLTGRTLELRGLVHIGFSLTPTIVVEDVHFGNAEWGSEKNMFHADRVAVKLALLPLLTGTIHVRRLDVRGARLLLEAGPQGEGNWDLAVATDGDISADEDETWALNGLPSVTVENLRLTYRPNMQSLGTEVFLDRADIEPRGNGFGIGMRGDVNGREASLSGFLAGTGAAFSVNDLKLSYDEISVSGKLNGRLPSGRGRIEIDGELVAEAIVLDSFLADANEPVEPGGALFDDAPLPFDLLDTMNGQIDVSVDRLSYKSFDLSDVHIAIELKGGALRMPVFATYAGSRIEAEMTAASGSNPRAGVTLNAPGLDVGRFLAETGATDLVSARGHVGVDLVARGRSVRALMASLDGRVDVVTGRGEIGSDAFELLAKDLLWALIPKGSDAVTAKLTCFVGELEFSSGVGDVTALALVTDKIRTSGEGTVNLGAEKIDLTLHPHPNDPGLLSLATPLRIAGSLTAPDVYPDAGALLRDVAVAVGAGILTGGVGAILPLISFENFDASSSRACMEVIADSRGDEENGHQGVLKATADGAGDIVRDVGDVLTPPFD